jgi:hypothetical protein
MELLKLFIPFTKTSSSLKPMEDHTPYRITTQNHNYRGQVVHQDGMVIKLRRIEGKPVKILKENIKSIVVL